MFFIVLFLGGKPDDITVLLSRVSARLPETAL